MKKFCVTSDPSDTHTHPIIHESDYSPLADTVLNIMAEIVQSEWNLHYSFHLPSLHDFPVAPAFTLKFGLFLSTKLWPKTRILIVLLVYSPVKIVLR